VPAAPAVVPLPVAAAHPEPGDEDGDEVLDEDDNCPSIRNGDQLDTDGDGAGDACDADDDADGVDDASDNCRVAANPDQADGNGNDVGDACDRDGDADGVADAGDNCASTPNPDQANLDADALGDACDPDVDGDGVGNAADNCPRLQNEDQADADGDGRGTPCDDREVTAPPPPGDGGSTGPGDGGGQRPVAVAVDDGVPPVVRLSSLRRAYRHAEVRASLPVGVSCSEACRLNATLTFSAGIFEGLQAGRGTGELGGAASTWVFVRLSRTALRPLRRQRRARLELRVTATDGAGRRTVVRRPVVFRR
jgi:Thrombospondin type 3 repeat